VRESSAIDDESDITNVDRHGVLPSATNMVIYMVISVMASTTAVNRCPSRSSNR